MSYYAININDLSLCFEFEFVSYCIDLLDI